MSSTKAGVAALVIGLALGGCSAGTGAGAGGPASATPASAISSSEPISPATSPGPEPTTTADPNLIHATSLAFKSDGLLSYDQIILYTGTEALAACQMDGAEVKGAFCTQYYWRNIHRDPYLIGFASPSTVDVSAALAEQAGVETTVSPTRIDLPELRKALLKAKGERLLWALTLTGPPRSDGVRVKSIRQVYFP